MARVDVDINSLVKIRANLIKLQGILNNGLSDTKKSLERVEGEVSAKYKSANAMINLLESEINAKKREADNYEAEYARQMKAADEAESQGKPSCRPYKSPQDMRNEAREKEKILEELKQARDELRSAMKDYKSLREEFMKMFESVATDSDGGDGEAQKVLTKSIETLDRYVQENFASSYSTQTSTSSSTPPPPPIMYQTSTGNTDEDDYEREM